MTTFEKLPTTTVLQSRCQLFQPTRRPKPSTGTAITTAWGTVSVAGTLGQSHADVMEAMMFTALQVREDAVGRTKLLVDPHQIRMTAGGGKQMSGEQLRKIINDILGAILVLKTDKQEVKGHILDTVEAAAKTAINPLTGAAEQRLWRVTLSREWSELIKRDIGRAYDPQPIAKLTYGISQAVTRHVLTHANQPAGGWKLDGLIGAAGGDASDRNMKRRMKEDAEAMAECGVVIDGDRVFKS